MKWVSLRVPILSECLRCVKLITGGVNALQTADPLHRQKHSDSARFDFFKMYFLLPFCTKCKMLLYLYETENDQQTVSQKSKDLCKATENRSMSKLSHLSLVSEILADTLLTSS